MGPYGHSQDSQARRLSETYDKLAGTLRRLPVSRQHLLIGALRMKPDDLRRAIKASGLTHYRLAQMAGITPEVIDRFMSGERDVRFETACKLATALELEFTPKRGKRKRKPGKGTDEAN